MKKVLYGLAIAAISISSCDKKTEDNAQTTSVEGTWNQSDMKEENGTYVYGGVQIGTFTMSSSNHNGTLQLKSDKTYSMVSKYDYSINSTINVTTTNVPGSVNQTMSGTYSYDASTKKLNMVYGAETYEYTVSELSSSKMVLTQQISVTQNGMTSKCDATITYSK